MILTVVLGLIVFVVAFIAFSPVVTLMCVAPFLLIFVFGMSRSASDAQMGLAGLGAFLPVAGWLGWGLYLLKYVPHNASTAGSAMAMGIAFFLLPLAALAGALVGAKLGGKWDRRHDGGTEVGLSFLRDGSGESD